MKSATGEATSPRTESSGDFGPTLVPARDSRAVPLMIHIIDELGTGGAQTHLETMLRHAVSAFPVKHRVISLFGTGPFEHSIAALGVPVDVLDLRPHLARGEFLGAARAVEEVLRSLRPDIVEAHLTWSRLLGLFAAWKARVPRRIAFEHGDLYLNSWKFRAAHWAAQHCCHRVIVVSRALDDWARRTYRLSRRRRTIVLNCVDVVRFHPAAAADASAVDRPAAQTVFGSVGSLGWGVNKRMDIAIRAVHAARGVGADVGLVVCGDGPQRADLEALADSLGVSAQVKFLGRRGDIPRVLATCDAFCLATAFDPCPVACLEAMATGLPAVVPNSGGMTEVVEHGVNGLVYPVLDVGELARAMSTLHADPHRRAAMGRAARKLMVEQFSVPTYMDRLYETFGL